MELLIATYRKMLQRTTSTFHRYMYDKIDWNSRLIGLLGPRGVGKTTLLLQRIKEHYDISDTLFVNVEDYYFASHRLVDLADEFCKMGGKHLFVDEIHRYEGWSRELKLIYDYHPELQVVFSGSSILDLYKGVESDLSRRAITYNMQGLSFREYLELFKGLVFPVVTIDDIVNQRLNFSPDFHPLVHFKEYMKVGYYPFALDDNYDLRLLSIINMTLEVDIPQYVDMHVSTGRKLKQLLAIIAKSVPFKPNMKAIGDALSVSRNNVADYLLYIEQSGLISQLRDDTGGIRGLGKVDKVYLDNTNLIYVLAGSNSEIGNVRETFFMNQLRVVSDPITSDVSDFQVNDMTFEIGGKSKKQKQIQGVANAYVVKDDIEYGAMNILPLWQFGLLY